MASNHRLPLSGCSENYIYGSIGVNTNAYMKYVYIYIYKAITFVGYATNSPAVLL